MNTYKRLRAPIIFLIIFSWIFGGWPRVYNFPSEIKVARAATATATWAFPSNVEGWTASTPNPNNTTAQWQSADGSPANGSLEMRIIGKNKTDNARTWEISGTWEALFSIPAGSTVTQVGSGTGNTYNYRVSEYTTGAAGQSGPFEFYDNTPALQGTFSTGVNFSGLVSWTTRNGSAISVPAGLRASSTIVRFRLTNNLATGSSTSAAVTLRQDTITLTITYTLPSSITAPSSVQMPDYTLGGAGYSERNFSDVSALVQVTAGAGFTVTVSSTNLTGTNNTISNTNVKLKTDGAAGANPTQILNCGGYSGIAETASGEYSLDTAQTIVTTSSGSGTCDIYPTIRVYISNISSYVEQDTGTLTFTVF
jgi:hypothetical protein